MELSEIEAVLAEHPEVRSASVRLLQRDGLQELAAYVVTRHKHMKIDRHELFSLLESRVPPYMIPGFLDVIDELPRTTSGKVDRRALPQPVCPLVRVTEDAVRPRTASERLVAEVWAEVLGVTDISATADFFLDLGGHSLVAAQTVTKIRETTGCPITVRNAYEFSTVQRLAAHLDSLRAAALPAARAADAASTSCTTTSKDRFMPFPGGAGWPPRRRRHSRCTCC